MHLPAPYLNAVVLPLSDTNLVFQNNAFCVSDASCRATVICCIETPNGNDG